MVIRLYKEHLAKSSQACRSSVGFSGRGSRFGRFRSCVRRVGSLKLSFPMGLYILSQRGIDKPAR